MTDHVECVVVGAGVIGLAIARALAVQGREVLVLEAEDAFGTHTSSRNSEVVHAGIYYPTGSLKARLCVSGKIQLYGYCQRHAIDFRRLGKLIVATSMEQVDVLRAYQVQGRANGVDDLELLSKQELYDLEPEVQGTAALWSPSTGIIDSHALMLTLLGELEHASGTLVLKSKVRSFSKLTGGFDLDIEAGGTPMRLQSDLLINAAGHGAVALAKASATDDVLASYYPAGHYFSYQGKAPFSHLVYPVAGKGSLGVHATLDLGGQLKFGPDLEWRDRLDYTFALNDARLQHFEKSVRDYYPGLRTDRLQPGYVGVRPRVSGPGEPLADFRIEGPQNHGIEGLVQLFGIESPGLTACLAIADEVGTLLAEN